MLSYNKNRLKSIIYCHIIILYFILSFFYTTDTLVIYKFLNDQLKKSFPLLEIYSTIITG